MVFSKACSAEIVRVRIELNQAARDGRGYGNAYADVLVGKPKTEEAMLWESRLA